MEKLGIKSVGKIEFVDVGAITYIEGAGNYSIIHTVSGDKFMPRVTLKALEGRLPENFLRIARSYLINTDYLVELNNELGRLSMARLSCGAEVRLSCGAHRQVLNDYLASVII